MLCVVGNLRVIVKWHIWSKRSIFIFKLVRFAHVLLLTVIQIVGGKIGMDNYNIAFFSVTVRANFQQLELSEHVQLSLVNETFKVVLAKEKEVRSLMNGRALSVRLLWF